MCTILGTKIIKFLENLYMFLLYFSNYLHVNVLNAHFCEKSAITKFFKIKIIILTFVLDCNLDCKWNIIIKERRESLAEEL